MRQMPSGSSYNYIGNEPQMMYSMHRFLLIKEKEGHPHHLYCIGAKKRDKQVPYDLFGRVHCPMKGTYV